MRAAMLFPVCLALSACTVTLHGRESAGGVHQSATSSSVRASASGSNYAARASFGSSAPPGASGGRLVLSRDASVAFVLGLVVVDMLNYLAAPSAAPAQPAPGAQRPIAHTCSCYGYRPDAELTQAATAE
jgi:hypothetical protein